MSRDVDINKVFVPSGQPEYTYVEREDGKYETILSSALDVGGQLC